MTTHCLGAILHVIFLLRLGSRSIHAVPCGDVLTYRPGVVRTTDGGTPPMEWHTSQHLGFFSKATWEYKSVVVASVTDKQVQLSERVVKPWVSETAIGFSLKSVTTADTEEDYMMKIEFRNGSVCEETVSFSLYRKPTEPVLQTIGPLAPGEWHNVTCQANSTSVPVRLRLPVAYTWTVTENGQDVGFTLAGEHNETLLLDTTDLAGRDIDVTCVAREGGSPLSSTDTIAISLAADYKRATVIISVVLCVVVAVLVVAIIAVWKCCERGRKRITRRRESGIYEEAPIVNTQWSKSSFKLRRASHVPPLPLVLGQTPALPAARGTASDESRDPGENAQLKLTRDDPKDSICSQARVSDKPKVFTEDLSKSKCDESYPNTTESCHDADSGRSDSKEVVTEHTYLEMINEDLNTHAIKAKSECDDLNEVYLTTAQSPPGFGSQPRDPDHSEETCAVNENTYLKLIEDNEPNEIIPERQDTNESTASLDLHSKTVHAGLDDVYLTTIQTSGDTLHPCLRQETPVKENTYLDLVGDDVLSILRR